MTSKNSGNKEGLVKLLCDYIPIIVFFAVYKFSNDPQPIIQATIYLLIATAIALLASYILIRKISTMALFSGIVLGIFGGLTIYLQDELFIKIKPTLLNSLFAIILFCGFFAKKPLLKYLLGSAIVMDDKVWLQLSLRFAIFFIFLAILNEIIWRNFSTDFWVQFKVFGMLVISIIFTISQAPFILKNSKQ